MPALAAKSKPDRYVIFPACLFCTQRAALMPSAVTPLSVVVLEPAPLELAPLALLDVPPLDVGGLEEVVLLPHATRARLATTGRASSAAGRMGTSGDHQ